MPTFHEAIIVKSVPYSIRFEAWQVKLKLFSKKNFVEYKYKVHLKVL